MSDAIDVYRFTRLKNVYIDTRLMQPDSENINDYSRAIKPITQYFIFKNIIQKLNNYCLDSLTIDLFDVASSKIYKQEEFTYSQLNYMKEDEYKTTLVDLKDYFPTFSNVKKLIIPFGLDNYVSFVFQRVFNVQNMTNRIEITDELLPFLFENKNEFHIQTLDLDSLKINYYCNTFKTYKNPLNIKSLNISFLTYDAVREIGFIHHLFSLCQMSLESLHISLGALNCLVQETDLSDITFQSLKELCIHDFGNYLKVNADNAHKYFNVPNVQIVTINCMLYDQSIKFLGNPFESGDSKEQKPEFGSIMDILRILNIKQLSVLNFFADIFYDIPQKYGDESVGLWLNDIQRCAVMNMNRMNVKLFYYKREHVGYSTQHIEKLPKVLDSFNDSSTCCQSILMKLFCVETEESNYELWRKIREDYSKSGWKINTGYKNCTVLVNWAKKKGECHMFSKGPICDHFIKYECKNCCNVQRDWSTRYPYY
eukprot:294936_1